ncbi:MAG: HAD family hydrolase [Anaerolineae bacterium]
MIHIRDVKLNPSLVAFDKDGTLVDLHSQWVPWTMHLLDRLPEQVSENRALVEHVAGSLGFDINERRILPDSPLATASRRELFVVIATALYQCGMPWVTAWDVSHKLEEGFEEGMWVKPRGDLRRLFDHLHQKGIRTAVVTTDRRANTQAVLVSLNIIDLVDCLVCADDGFAVKPAPDMLAEAMRCAGVRPDETVMVGDTIYDMLMADRAGVQARIGIINGGGSEDMLRRYTMAVIHSLDEIQVI